MKTAKTYKRETAIALLLALSGLFLWGLIAQRVDVVEVGKFLTMPVFLFLGGAFGIDAMAKQFGG